MMVGGGGESRALARLRHEAQHWSPPTPETNEDGKRENNRFIDRERNSQTGTEIHTDKAGTTQMPTWERREWSRFRRG